MFFYQKLFNLLLSTVAPIECLHCGQSNDWCCLTCQKLLIEKPAIIINNYHKQIQKIICAYNYQYLPAQKIIHACKYDGLSCAIEPLAKQLAFNLKSEIKSHFALLLPVPLHPARLRQRGFNQSEIIAKVIADELNLPLVSCQRIVNTPHQVGLDSQQRQLNMKNVFAFNSQKQNLNIIIIDDVITTGATIKSLADALAPYCNNIIAAAIAKE
jgi:ComF family protein